MYDAILFPTDGSDGAAVGLEHALDIAAAHGATLHVLNVADTTRDSVVRVQGQVVDALEREGQRVVREAAERARERGVETVTEVLQGEPARTIVEYAEARGVDLVVVPTRGRSGLRRFLLGSTAERVVRQATVPVLTVRPDEDLRLDYPSRNVLVPTDGSDCAREALSVGVDVANVDGASLHVLSVVDTASLGVDVRTDVQSEQFEASANETVRRAVEFAEEAGVESVTGAVESGASVHRAILSYVDGHDVDLVVVGSHGRTGLDRYILGSVTAKLLRTAPVPVLIVGGSGPSTGD
jgi:nucleotide-binding universal stress UspA family protein